MLEKTLESPLDWKEINPVNPKGNHPWIFIGRTDSEAEAAILWPPDAKNWHTGKDPDAGKDWRQEEKGTTGWDGWWHHGLNGHEFEHVLGAADEQGSLACCSSWGCKESDTTEWLKGTKLLTQKVDYNHTFLLPLLKWKLSVKYLQFQIERIMHTLGV